jgi:hypothetical protein
MEKAKLQVLGLLKTPWLPCIQNTMHLDQPTTLSSILTFGWDNASCVCNFKYSHLDLTMWVVCATSNTHIRIWQCELYVQLQILTFRSDNVSCICGNDIPKKTRQTIWMMAKNGKTKHSLNQKILQVSNPKEQHTGSINSTTKNTQLSSPFKMRERERERERESN